MREVTIRGDMIRLGQFLKLADAVDAGSDVKQLLAAGRVSVNGEAETRRGRQLVRGDEVAVAGEDRGGDAGDEPGEDHREALRVT